MIIAGTALAAAVAALGVDSGRSLGVGSSRSGGKRDISATRPHAYNEEWVELHITFRGEGSSPWSNDMDVWRAEDRAERSGGHRRAIREIMAFYLMQMQGLHLTSGDISAGRVGILLYHQPDKSASLNVRASRRHRSTTEYQTELGVQISHGPACPTEYLFRAIQARGRGYRQLSRGSTSITLTGSRGSVNRRYPQTSISISDRSLPVDLPPTDFTQVVLDLVMEVVEKHRRLYAENDQVIRDTILELAAP